MRYNCKDDWCIAACHKLRLFPLDAHADDVDCDPFIDKDEVYLYALVETGSERERGNRFRSVTLPLSTCSARVHDFLHHLYRFPGNSSTDKQVPHPLCWSMPKSHVDSPYRFT